ALFELAKESYERTKTPRFCPAGGCAYNSLANGIVFDRSAYKDLYIQAAAGHAGGAIGAAYWVWNEILGNTKSFVMTHAYWGPEYDDVVIDESITARRADLNAAQCTIERVADERELCRRTAARIANGDVVGGFQG